MRLVDYDSSGSDSDFPSPPPKLRRQPPTAAPPPLPAAFHDLYAGPPRLSRSDDPSLHAGRTRLVPHIEGNWAAHVYLEWHPSAADSALITDLITTLDPSLTSSLHDSTRVPQPLHMSLSIPLVLSTETKDNFHTDILASLAAAARSLPETVQLAPVGLAWHPNAARTRGFLVLRVAADPALEALLAASNTVAVRHGHNALYGGAAGERFHVSIAWGLEPGLYAPGPVELDTKRQALMARVSNEVRMGFNEVKVKIGRDVSSVPFGRRRTTTR